MSIKDVIRNPIFYFILIPAVLAVWPVSVALVYLPNVEKSIVDEEKEYQKAEDLMMGILNMDPDRISSGEAKKQASEFDYVTAVEQIAKNHGIAPGTYSISAQPIRVVEKEKTKSASVVLQKVTIEQFASFLTSLQTRWTKLECESIELTKLKGLPNSWKVTLKFKYYY